jgi:hypothetical protein
LTLVWPLFAAFSAEVGVEDLRKALSRYQAIEKLDVDFKQTKHLSDLALDLNSEGHLSLRRPDHVEWKITKPESLSVELEGGRIRIHGAKGDETFDSADAQEADRRRMEALLNWLKLDADAIARDFTIEKKDTTHFTFTAKPGHPSLVTALEMELAASGHVTKLLFRERSGDEIRLSFGTPKLVYKQGI